MDYLRRCSFDEGTLESDAEYDVDVNKTMNMLTDFFQTTRSLFWLEILSLTGNVRTGLAILRDELWQVKSQVRTLLNCLRVRADYPKRYSHASFR